MTIEEQVRAEFPFFTVYEDGVTKIISPETDPELYEAMIAERVAWRQQQEEEEAIEEVESERRQQAKAAIEQLEADADLMLTGAPTAAQTRQVIGRLCRVAVALIRILIRKGIIE